MASSSHFIDSFCKPEDVTWASITSAFGKLTPCFTDIVILGSANVATIVLCIIRLWALSVIPPSSLTVLRRRLLHGIQCVAALVCAVIPMLQLSAHFSVIDESQDRALPPFEIASLLLGTAAWIVICTVFYVEATYAYTGRYTIFVRFGLVWIAVGQLSKLQIVWTHLSKHSGFFFNLFITETALQCFLGALALLYHPLVAPKRLDQDGAGGHYLPLATGPAQGEALPEAALDSEDMCPERRVGLLSSIFFSWMTPLLALGYNRPLQDGDIWKLDTWDRTATVFGSFEAVWKEELKRTKPSLLRAMVINFGPRFFIGGFFKIGNDASQFVGPMMLNLLLSSMQANEPSWKGYVYAAIIFIGLMGGVLCENQYFQNVMRVGFRIRATLVAMVFRKSIQLSHEGRKAFSSGRITNMMTTDAESLQLIMTNLNNLWSAPTRITVAMVLLYRELGVASLAGPTVLLLMMPIQAIVVQVYQKLAKKSLEWTDKRIELVSELLGAVDVIKCYVWESSFEEKVNRIRNTEMNWLARGQYFNVVNSFLLTVIPVLVSVLTFALYTFLGNELTPAKAFTTLALFNVLRFPLFTLPQLIVQVASAQISLGRLQELFLADERSLEESTPAPPGELAVEVHNGSFRWSLETETPTLTGVNISIPSGSLVAIVGATGQGKTSLISALLGEMPTAADNGSDEATVRGSIAYVPQTSWIFNATVRDNIIFGLPFDHWRYQSAIHAAALEKDLELLPGGDLTEIGERGVNVSGGQKQRISIARALYSNADVFFFDDPLSALDAVVARHVFETSVLQALAGKTRVMATNQMHFLPRFDHILFVHEGRIVEQGTYNDLMALGGAFKDLCTIAMQGGEEEAGSATDTEGPGREEDNRSASSESGRRKHEDEEALPKKKAEDDVNGKGNAQGVTLIKQEERETGAVSRYVIDRYVVAMGNWPALAFLIILYVLVEAVRLLASAWLALWSGAATEKKGPTRRSSAGYYNRVYGAISMGQILLTLINQFFIVYVSQRAARTLNKKMLAAVLRAPMVFFQTSPLGRLINRFSKDTADIDKNLAVPVNMFLSGLFQLLSTLFLVGIMAPFALSAVIPLVVAFCYAYLYFQTTAREVKRLDAITRSPVYAQFQEALNGLATIRAFRAQRRVAEANGRAMDTNLRLTLATMGANRWLSIRLEFLGGLMIFFISVFAILDRGNVADQAGQAASVGLVLGYALSITSLMTIVLRLASVAENSFNAVERVGTYIDIQPEDRLSRPGAPPSLSPPPSWPSGGTISFEDVVMRYRPELPPVLRGLTASIRSHEKVGIAGRTGAGKSSLFNALFRLVELESGRIVIDGVDVGRLALHNLRAHLGIIPQVPVLFTGTIRLNLDPFSQHLDAELWEALDRAHLKPIISQGPLGLDTEVLEGGNNFSVGQRQLLSLARALVRHAPILVLDEATAAVDAGTDALIQKTIRTEFKGCTMLTIAHRLNTIIDSDRVLVLDAGRAAEFGTPSELLSIPGGIFAEMVSSTGGASARHLQGIAAGEAAGASLPNAAMADGGTRQGAP